jgi:hypothetical protein
LRQNLQQVAPNQEKPHTTPLHSLIYSIYISVLNTHSVGNLSPAIGGQEPSRHRVFVPARQPR